MKYIDTYILRKEIEKRIKSSESCPFIEAEFGAEERREGKIRAYKEILDFINSLQQEQPSEDLEEEISTWIPAHISGGDNVVWKDAKAAIIEWAGIVARHFAQWGAKWQKEQMMKEDEE